MLSGGQADSLSFDKDSGPHIVECPQSADQQVNELEDGYHITATARDSEVVDRWLRGFGQAVNGISKQHADENE